MKLLNQWINFMLHFVDINCKIQFWIAKTWETRGNRIATMGLCSALQCSMRESLQPNQKSVWFWIEPIGHKDTGHNTTLCSTKTDLSFSWYLMSYNFSWFFLSKLLFWPSIQTWALQSSQFALLSFGVLLWTQLKWAWSEDPRSRKSLGKLKGQCCH